MMDIKSGIDAAVGKKKAELVLKNCNIINVFTLEIIKGDIAIEADYIVGIGEYSGETEVDVDGKYVAPGFIDSHVHLESSMVTPARFAEAVVPCGTTTVIADPHEIANVCGADGIRYILEESKNVPLDVHVMIPSCVPATPFEEAGAVLDAKAVDELLDLDGVLGLAELMNYPGVLSCDEDILKKVEAAKKRNMIIDGHAPRLSNKELAGYVMSGALSDHECTSRREMMEKMRLGMYIHIRNGTIGKEIRHLIKGIKQNNMRFATFCTDDRHPHDIIKIGHINSALKIAVENGVEPAAAVAMATLNPATCYGLEKVGAIAPGYIADIVVLKDVKGFAVEQVYKAGKLVAENGVAKFEAKSSDTAKVTGTVKFQKITVEDLKIKLDKERVRVIMPADDSVQTIKSMATVTVKDGYFQYDRENGICKVVVVERHQGKKSLGVGLISRFEIKNGAIAQTIAHDSHNIVAVGDNDADIVTAVNELSKDNEGGVILVHGGEVIKKLALPIAGLMSTLPLRKVSEIIEDIEETAYNVLEMNRTSNPMMVLAFLALPVIPEMRVTTKGLFDVSDFKFVDTTEEV